MNNKSQKAILRQLLLSSSNRSRLWASMAALCIGTTLLLISVGIWWDFNELLYGSNKNDAIGSTYIVIGKRVTDQKMGKPQATLFTPQEIEDIKHAPQVQDVGIITSNRFPVYAVLGGRMAFETDMAVESVPDKFMDKLPEDWKWEPGSRDLPMVMSSDFLNIYNYVFAPSQRLPQLSERSVMALAIQLKAGTQEHNETLFAHVTGFSDRIGSVLVPQSFIDYGNQKYGNGATTVAPSQLILKTLDPSDAKFAAYLQQHDYSTNPENLRWSMIRSIVEVVTTATGILALILMGLGSLVFILFIELTIARAQASVTLLQQIGYAPRYLSRFMIKRFIPLVVGTVLFSGCLTIAAQMASATVVKAQGLELSTFPGYPVWIALCISLLLLLILVSRAITVAIRKG